MTHVVYVNGRYVPYKNASVHVEDRGYQFADGVYEVYEVRGGHVIEEEAHGERLQRSLAELKIRAPMSLAALGVVLRECIRRNRIGFGMLYLQVTRGASPRDFAFPPSTLKPAVVCFARRLSRPKIEAKAARGISILSQPDMRWKRVDIKSTGLLGASLAKQAAKDAGADDAWLVDDAGYITEGSSSNAWIVTSTNEIVTRGLDGRILSGITRQVILAAARERGLEIVERAFHLDEAKNAREAFQTSTTALIMPVIKIDGHVIGDGKPGSVTVSLRQAYFEAAEISDPHRLFTKVT